MRPRQPGSLALMIVAALSLGRLAAAAEAPARPDPMNRLLVFHSWTLPPETTALKALLDRFAAKYPGVAVSDQVFQNGGGNQKTLFPILLKLAATQRAPEALQAHAGYATQPFFDGGLLNPIDVLWQAEGLPTAIPPFIRSMINLNGHLYSVPIGVHRMNVVWYNKALLNRNGIDPASLTTWEAFFKAADRLKASGVASPIRMGKAWTESVVFQAVVASLGISAYEDWINGKITAPDDPRMQRAFEVFGRYLSYVNADHASLEWNKALQPVIAGEAAFNIMGDWSDGEFRLAGKKYGKDYGAIPVPGTKELYGVAVDTFVQLTGAGNVTNSDRWLRLLASREAQDTYNVIKGSIPARNDADVARYGPYQKSAIADFRNAKHYYPNGDEAMPLGYRTSLDEALAGFAEDRDGKKAASRLADAATKLAGKYTRSWSLK